MPFSQPVRIAPAATKKSLDYRGTAIARAVGDIDQKLAEHDRAVIQDFCRRAAQLPPTETTSITFCCIGNHPIKQTVKVSQRMFGPANVNVSSDYLTEADIEETLRVTQDYEARVRLRNYLNLIRAIKAEPEPLAVKLVNPGAVGSEKAIRITRDDNGKITGAVTQPLT